MARAASHTTSEELTLSSRGYRLQKRLGEGSYARVYLADFRTTGLDTKPRQLACKIIDINKAPPDFVKKFLPRELDILIKINHPHIIHVHSIFQRKNKYFIFMRFAENGDLLDFILKKGAVSEAQARVWLRQIALALQYLHDMEIAHRDLKCENILITLNYNVKLADFGFARYVIDPNGKRLTSETYCGSLSYAAPDILKGAPYHPKIADMWSLGVVLYIILNKAMPFDDTNIRKLYEQQTAKKWKFRSKVVGILSEKLKKLMDNLLEPDVSKRWRVEQVLASDWFAMDPRLLKMNSLEHAAIVQAHTDRKKNPHKKDGRNLKESKEDVMVWKQEERETSLDKSRNKASLPSLVEDDIK